VRAGAFIAALALSTSLIGAGSAQVTPIEVIPAEVDAPQLPPEAPKPSSITAIPLPAEPPPAPRVAPKRAPMVAKPAPVVPKTTMTPPAPVVVQKPAPPTPAPVAAPKVQAECVIKPVMSDDELRACGAAR
jgi:hypothetical protein